MATTFSQAASEIALKVRNSRAVCSTGTEAATVLDAASGLDLFGITGFVVHVEAAVAMTAGKLFAYIYNQLSGKWNRAESLDVTVGAYTAAAALSPVNPLPTFSRGTRIAYLPNGLAQACVVDINGTPLHNIPLQ
jgi:hypothetical protein